MKNRNSIASPTRRPRSLTSLLALLVLLSAQFAGARAQTSPTQPRREQLLNGLKIVLVNRPGDPQVLLKLRVHSGAAFDLAGKEGTMALLSDALFPDASTREYVSEELGGRLEVTTDYDSVNVTLTGRASEFERLVDLLRTALINTQLTPDVTARLREARLKTVRDLGAAPSTVADRAAAARLFGPFPYARAAGGTPESIARVERPDLMLARERFLNPNNATLVSIGGVENARAFRTIRQFLGSWRRSDRDVPATFRQPDAPDARTLIVDMPGVPDTEIRLSARGLTRTDRDTPAARVVAALVRERWLKAFPELTDRPFFVEHQPYFLPGVLRLGATVPTALSARALETARAAVRSLADTPPTTAELETVKRDIVAGLNARAGGVDFLANSWLDRDTYKIENTDEARAIESLTPAEVSRVAARLFRGAPLASVAVGDAARLRSELAGAGEVEVLGASAGETPKTPVVVTPLQQQTKVPIAPLAPKPTPTPAPTPNRP